MEECGFTPVIPQNESSIIITAYYEPAGFDFENFHSYMKERGFIVYPGKLTDGKSFRIANIGNITLDDVYDFLTLVKEYMKNAI
jgi:2-aminoethylphosphonate-pyruvate transaminase